MGLGSINVAFTVFLALFASRNTVPVDLILATSSQQTSVVMVEETPFPLILRRIAQCESNNRQFNNDGSVLRGFVNPKDVGLFQINEDAWGDKALELGFDIYTTSGNMKMARWIYDNYGESPWIYSKKCWSKLPSVTKKQELTLNSVSMY